jgi:hypothetical protein
MSPPQRNQLSEMSHTPIHHEQQVFQPKSRILEDESAVELRQYSSSPLGSYPPDPDGTARDEEHLFKVRLPEATGGRWTPGFWAHLPVLGLLSLIGSLLGKPQYISSYCTLLGH